MHCSRTSSLTDGTISMKGKRSRVHGQVRSEGNAYKKVQTSVTEIPGREMSEWVDT